MDARTKRVLLPAGVVGVVGAVVAATMAVTHGGEPRPGPAGGGMIAAGGPGSGRVHKAPKPFELGECPAPNPSAGATPAAQGNPAARQAAQKGLDFLSVQARAWQDRNQCFGCHVHAVTIEAFSVGRHHQYEVSGESFSTLLEGVLRMPGGARTQAGFSYHGDSLPAPSKAFGGAALARYDAWVDHDLRDDLLRAADELLDYQQEDGSIKLDWFNPPVGVGAIQGTYQAIQTWQQAYARTADDRWLTAVQKGEGFLQAQVAQWKAARPENLQDLNYALLGLLAAGVGGSEESMLRLTGYLVEAQNADGGWGFSAGVESNPFVTGQSLYVLRMLGRSDGDPVIAKGTSWLIERQRADGGWSDSGFGKAEAMWGVLGLVSLDVLTLSLEGVQDGQHVADRHQLHAHAVDNAKGGGVREVQLVVDDIVVFGACGGDADWTWNTSDLEDGRHVVEAVATNAAGQVSRRRVEVYSGPIYLTQLGSKFSDGGTVISMRNIAPATLTTAVELQVHEADETSGAAKPGRLVATRKATGRQGSMSFFWDGRGDDGVDRAHGKYVAVLVVRDDHGAELSRAEVAFVHDTPEAQRADYGEISGALAMPEAPAGGAAGAPAASTNTKVQLVDDQGRVVQEAVTTKEGQYRFRNVDGGKKYKVRVEKHGFKPVEHDVDGEKGADKPVDLLLEK